MLRLSQRRGRDLALLIAATSTTRFRRCAVGRLALHVKTVKHTEHASNFFLIASETHRLFQCVVVSLTCALAGMRLSSDTSKFIETLFFETQMLSFCVLVRVTCTLAGMAP